MKRLLFPLLALIAVMSSCDDTTDGVGVSLIDNGDQISNFASTFCVNSETIHLDSVISRSNVGYLGKVKDPETGAYITSNFMTQFHTLDDFEFPPIDSVMSKVDGQVVCDSVTLNLLYTSYFGDSTAAMKCMIYEMDRPMEESQQYYSAFSPMDNGYIRKDGLQKSKVYTTIDYNEFSGLSSSEIESKRDSFMLSIPVCLNGEYTDKNGNKYNNYGTYIMRKYYENPQYFHNSYNFIHNVCPGFYIKSTGGIGSMAYITKTQLAVYFKIYNNDTIYTTAATFYGTEEVLQKTDITQDKKKLDELVADGSCTYMKTPAGLLTQLEFPVDSILDGHENDTLNTARVFISRENNTVASDYSLPVPSTILLLPADSLQSFFANRDIADYRNSYLTSYSSSTNGYTFGNISSMIRNMGEAKQTYLKNHSGMTSEEYNALFPNWNKAVMVPVTTSYTTISSSQVLTTVSHDMSLGSTRLHGGKDNPGTIKINIIYSKFE